MSLCCLVCISACLCLSAGLPVFLCAHMSVSVISGVVRLKSEDEFAKLKCAMGAYAKMNIYFYVFIR